MPDETSGLNEGSSAVGPGERVPSTATFISAARSSSSTLAGLCPRIATTTFHAAVLLRPEGFRAQGHIATSAATRSAARPPSPGVSFEPEVPQRLPVTGILVAAHLHAPTKRAARATLTVRSGVQRSWDHITSGRLGDVEPPRRPRWFYTRARLPHTGADRWFSTITIFRYFREGTSAVRPSPSRRVHKRGPNAIRCGPKPCTLHRPDATVHPRKPGRHRTPHPPS